LQLRTQIGHGGLHGLGIGQKVRRAGRQMGGENRHGKPQSEKATLVDVDVNVNLHYDTGHLAFVSAHKI
jgi:hypothetical protein